MSLTYSSYLKLDELLNAQTPQSTAEHDEMLFIIIHQSYELWFKQILHEKNLLNHSFSENREFQAIATLKRMLAILKPIVGQIDILETMTPLSFASFRDRLESSSGFQSWQFRLLESYMGRKEPAKLKNYPEGSPEYTALEKALEEPALFDHFLRFIHNFYAADIPGDILNRNVAESYKADERLTPVFLNIYKNHPPLQMLCELLVDLDEGFQEWRYRHVKMVERTIGSKSGTGGSAGIEYLKKSLFKSSFPDLWAVRSRF